MRAAGEKDGASAGAVCGRDYNGGERVIGGSMGDTGRARTRALLLEDLRARGILADGGETTVYGQPAWREVPCARAPQALMDASALQRRLVACAAGTAPMGADQCAAWVERAFSRLGMGYVSGDARALYEGFCSRTDTRELLVGMICAVGRHPFGIGGWDHGHVGLYVGDGLVADCVDARVRRVPIELWASAYGVASEPRWGWIGAVALG